MRGRFLIILVPTMLLANTWGVSVDWGVAQDHQGHRAHHGGVLNVIGKELAHVEVRVQEDTLEAWFVGGGHDTGRSVQIKAAEIALTLSIPGRGRKDLVLKADPLRLAGEKEGHCSHFVARADWLKDVKEFEAVGSVVIRGMEEKLIIRYPEGHDPLHRHGDEHRGKKHR